MFWNKTKRKHHKRPYKSLKQILADSLYQEVSNDPELRKALAFKEAGYEDMLKTADPLEQKKAKIGATIVDRALKKIEADPELTERFVDNQVEDIMNEGVRGTRSRGRHDSRDADDGYEGSASIFGQAIQSLDEMEEFRERIGKSTGGGGLIASLVTQDNVNEFLKIVRGLMSKGPMENGGEATVVVS